MTALVPPHNVRPLTVSERTGDIKNVLETRFADGVWVTGEVSNLSRPSSGQAGKNSSTRSGSPRKITGT